MLSISYINMGWQFQSLLHYVGKIGVPLIVVNRTHMTVQYWQRQSYWIIALPGRGGECCNNQNCQWSISPSTSTYSYIAVLEKILHDHNNFSGLHLRLILRLGSQLLSFHLLLSAAFTPVITPIHYIPITLYYGLQSGTMVPTSCQVRAGTLTHTPTVRWCHLLHFNHIFPGFVFFFSISDMKLLLSDTGQGPPTAYTLLYPAGASFSFNNQLQSQTAICPCTCS